MASSKEYLAFIIDQLSDLKAISYRRMMGEYVIYYGSKIAGYIFDDRLLVKPVKSAIEYIENPTFESPYPGAKEMLVVKEVDDKDYLTVLFETMYDELPLRKEKLRR